jgi:hypothetical protein
MWFSNSWNNFAPFAGFMFRGYEKRRALERAGDEIDESAASVRAVVRTGSRCLNARSMPRFPTSH